MPSKENKYNLPPYRFCDGGEATDKKATDTGAGDQSTNEPTKTKVGEKEYTEEQLQKALEDSENMSKFLAAQGKKNERLNAERREVQVEREDLQNKIGRIEAEMEALKSPPVDPSEIEDADERRKYEDKQLRGELTGLKQELVKVNRKLETADARDKTRIEDATHGAWRNEMLDEFGYEEKTELDIDSNKMLDSLMAAQLLPRKSFGWTREQFEDAAKSCKTRVEAFRQLALKHQKEEEANADKIVGGGGSPAPEAVKINRGDDKRTTVGKIAKKYGITEDDRGAEAFT